jgi:hypothetical protein
MHLTSDAITNQEPIIENDRPNPYFGLAYRDNSMKVSPRSPISADFLGDPKFQIGLEKALSKLAGGGRLAHGESRHEPS